MIDPKELRIGNLVQHPEHDTWKWEFSRDDFDLYEMQEFNPIPLTPEWLEKLGVVEEWTTGGFLKWEVGRLKLLDRRLPHPQYHSADACILNVHQLQNLYFALTGKELIID